MGLDEKVKRNLALATAGGEILNHLTELHSLNDLIVLLMPDDSRDLNRTSLLYADQLSEQHGSKEIVILTHNEQILQYVKTSNFRSSKIKDAIYLPSHDIEKVLKYISVNPHIPLSLFVCSLDKPAGRSAAPYDYYELSLDELTCIGIYGFMLKDFKKEHPIDEDLF
jgi:hypothetical protein